MMLFTDAGLAERDPAIHARAPCFDASSSFSVDELTVMLDPRNDRLRGFAQPLKLDEPVICP